MTKLARPCTAVAATLAATCAAAAPAQAHAGVRVTVHHAGAGVVRVKAAAPTSARRVSFAVDGRRRAVARHRPFTRRIGIRRLRRGRHVMTARVRTRAGVATGRRVFRVTARAAAASVSSPLQARVTAPAWGAKVSGEVTITADVGGGSATNYSIRAFVDGQPVGADEQAPWSVRWDTSDVSQGDHRIRVVAYDGQGRALSQKVIVNVIPADPPVTGTGQPGWTSTFESGTLDEWSVRDFGVDNTATIENVASGADGVPAHSGSRMAKFQVTATQSASGHYHAKLYKIWTRPDGPLSTFHEDATGDLAPQMPATDDVSGTYSAWYYFPSDYTRDPAVHDWTNIFHFKQWFSDKQVVGWGVYVSAASQWGGLRTPDGSPQWDGPSDQRPVMGVVAGGFGNWDYELRSVPVGRWFELKAVVHQGQSIEWYLDGQPWRTVYQSRFPVGAVPDP